MSVTNLAVAVAGGAFLLFIGWAIPYINSNSEENNRWLKEKNALWENASVVRICPDGTRIWRLSDGSYSTGFLLGNRVENPNAVCTIQLQ